MSSSSGIFSIDPSPKQKIKIIPELEGDFLVLPAGSSPYYQRVQGESGLKTGFSSH